MSLVWAGGGGGGILKLLLVLYGFFSGEGVVSYSVILLQTHCVLHSQFVLKGTSSKGALWALLMGIFFFKKRKISQHLFLFF